MYCFFRLLLKTPHLTKIKYWWLEEGVCQDGVGETDLGWATGFLWFWMIVLLLLVNCGLTEFWLITIEF